MYQSSFVHLNRQIVYLTLMLIFWNISTIFSQSVIISEVMFIPSDQNSEYIELINTSETEIIDLSGFQVKYHTSSPDEIVSPISDFRLLPNQYAVIFEADYNFTNGIYENIIPDSTLVLILDDNAFGSRGMANTGDRLVYLIDSNGDTVDVHMYSADNDNGYSDERVGLLDDVWENSIVFNGTPGKRNSVSPRKFDLFLYKFTTNTENVIIGDSVVITIEIKNLGIETAEDFILNIYKDKNNNSLPEPNEIVKSENYRFLYTGDSLKVIDILNNITKGNNVFIAEIEYENDEFIDNNIMLLSVKGIETIKEKADLVINEFMYAPQNSESEWIEIFNRSELEINLKKYQIADNSNTLTLLNAEYIIKSNNYIVFADDSSIFEFYPNLDNIIVTSLPTLNNSGDRIIIMDSLSRVIDSLTYFSDWGGKNGSSLERIDPFGTSNNILNWSESFPPTPGFINSVTQKEYDVTIGTVFTNPKFPLVGTRTTFFITVKNIGKNETDFIIEMFADINQDSTADNLLEITAPLNLKSGDSLSYNFVYSVIVAKIESNYIFRLKASDDDTTNNSYIFKLKPIYPFQAIFVNEIMYAPKNDEPEWIELFNNSEYDINIKDWVIIDILTNPVKKTIPENYFFPSKTYMVIAKSNSIYNFHKNINSPVLQLKFANLNNDEDGVVIKDNNNRTIDSVKYFSDWGGNNGRSIERINIEYGTNNKNNWGNSIDLEESTPGRINSITVKDFDLSIKILTSLPEYPIEGENIKLKAMISNNGKNDAENFALDFFIKKGLDKEILEKHTNMFLTAGDSIFVTSDKSVEIGDTLIIAVGISFNKDEDIINNYTEKTIISGFNKNTVLINEIMFKPFSGEPEWIEIVNNSDSIINLSNWLIGDLKNRAIITQEITNINSGEFAIISDSRNNQVFETEALVIQTDLPELGNSKDAVIIYDYRYAVIDSTNYNVTNKFKIGNSLERISIESKSTNTSNWTFSLSQNGSTPGEVNSITNLPNYVFDDVIITEIMFDPLETNSEFIEIFNNSAKEVEIGGWKIEDKDGLLFEIMDKSFLLAEKQLFVIAADSSILKNYNWLVDGEDFYILNLSSLSLTNSGKKLILKDVKNNIVDSINYSDNWHNSAFEETKNISLELINSKLQRNNSKNWSSSVSELGATPCLENSISMENLISNSKLEITPNPFSPDSDGYEDFSFINYNLSQSVSQIRVRIFDSKGRFIKSLANNEAVGSRGTIIFDGLDRNKKPLKIGIYIILFEAVNFNNAVIDVIKDVIVVARKL